jgi:hypothetical protein
MSVETLLRVYGHHHPDFFEGRRRQDDGQAYRLSFASETSRKEEDERRQNSMKLRTFEGNAAGFHRS